MKAAPLKYEETADAIRKTCLVRTGGGGQALNGGNGARLAAAAPAVPDPNGHRQRFRPGRVRRGHGSVRGGGGGGRQRGLEGRGRERSVCKDEGNKRTERKANKRPAGGVGAKNLLDKPESEGLIPATAVVEVGIGTWQCEPILVSMTTKKTFKYLNILSSESMPS